MSFERIGKKLVDHRIPYNLLVSSLRDKCSCVSQLLQDSRTNSQLTFNTSWSLMVISKQTQAGQTLTKLPSDVRKPFPSLCEKVYFNQCKRQWFWCRGYSSRRTSLTKDKINFDNFPIKGQPFHKKKIKIDRHCYSIELQQNTNFNYSWIWMDAIQPNLNEIISAYSSANLFDSALTANKNPQKKSTKQINCTTSQVLSFVSGPIIYGWRQSEQ